MIAELARYVAQLAGHLHLNSPLVLLTIIVLAAFIVINAVITSAHKTKEDSGIGATNNRVSIDGVAELAVKQYMSESQGLAGRPDAVIVENGFPIPVERKPLARKIRDRYIAQLLVYLRLIEEFEGKKPPYGYLILGPSCRKVKIENTPERQAWLQTKIDQMRTILDSGPCVPVPQRQKCEKCDVRKHCKYGGFYEEKSEKVDKPAAEPRD